MGGTLRRLHSGVRSLLLRMRQDGLGPTWQWLHGHAWPCLSGIPSPRFSRVTSQVFVGAQISRAGRRRLEQLGVQASVNLRAEFDDVTCGLAFPEHLHLPTVDGDPPTLEQLAEGVG